MVPISLLEQFWFFYLISTNFFPLVQSCSLPFCIYMYSSCISGLYDTKSSIIINMNKHVFICNENPVFCNMTEVFSYWQWMASCGVDSHACSLLFLCFFVYLQLIRQFVDPDLLKSVLLFKGGLTTLWLMCLVWFKHSPLTSTQSWMDAGLLLHNPDARMRDAERSIISPQDNPTQRWWDPWGSTVSWKVDPFRVFPSLGVVTVFVSYALWLVVTQGFWCEACGVRQVGHTKVLKS